MGTGISLPLGFIASGISTIKTISSIPVNNNKNIQNVESAVQSLAGPWTPPQYAEPALTVLTVPGSNSSTSGQPSTLPVYYVFDAMFRLAHHRRLRKTQHPVLTGANISDHAYLEPAQLVLDIGMSDAMASFTEGIWVGASTKSISAYQILKQLQLSKTLLTISTRLDIYYNMLIMDLSSPDDNKTKHALRALITLEELISASVLSTPAVSSRPQTTDNTSGGVVQSTPPNQTQVLQNVIPSTQWPNVQQYPNVPGAGNVSSTNLGNQAGAP